MTALLRIITSGGTSPGRRRAVNEDAWCSLRPDGSDDTAIAIVADGVGGRAGGEHASQLAVAEISRVIATRPRHEAPEATIRRGLAAANSTIYDAAVAQPELRGMATTIVAAVVRGDRLTVQYVGDSRAYLIRNACAHQLTVDHTWVQHAVAAGRYLPSDVSNHANRHTIMRSLGARPTVEIDDRIVAPSPADADVSARYISQLTLRAGDTVLLCSDGLHDVIPDDQIGHAFVGRRDQKVVDHLIDLANAAGGPDNITVVTLRLARRRIRKPTGQVGKMTLTFLMLFTALLIGFFVRNRTPDDASSPAREPTTVIPTADSAAVDVTILPAPDEDPQAITMDQPTPQPASIPTNTPAPTATSTSTATSTPTRSPTPPWAQTQAVTDIPSIFATARSSRPSFTPTAHSDQNQQPVQTDQATAAPTPLDAAKPVSSTGQSAVRIRILTPLPEKVSSENHTIQWRAVQDLQPGQLFNMVIFPDPGPHLPPTWDGCDPAIKLIPPPRTVGPGTIGHQIEVELAAVIEDIIAREAGEQRLDPPLRLPGSYWWSIALYTTTDDVHFACLLSRPQRVEVIP